MLARMTGWFKSHLPTRESIAANRWTRPFAKYLLRPDLWRLNRRSVPRAVAIGLLLGPIVPVAHTAVAAILAVPSRANIVIAVATTWLISNPATWIPLYSFSSWLGSRLLNSGSTRGLQALKLAWSQGWAETLQCLSTEGKAIALGVLIVSVFLAAIGYLLSSLLWRLWIGHQWQLRRKRRVA